MSGTWLVSGPGTEGKSAPTWATAVSLAQTLACRADRPGTWYVRQADGTVSHHVTREADRSVTTRRVAPEAEPRKRQPAPTTTLEEAA